MNAIRSFFLAVLISLTFNINASTTYYSGTYNIIGNVELYDQNGMSLTPLPSFMNVYATINFDNNTMSVNDYIFFGLPITTYSVELLHNGIYSRPNGAGGNYTINVGTNQLGAYMSIGFLGINFPIVMVWNINFDQGELKLIPIDSDGDGILGSKIMSGPFPGFSLVYNFSDEIVIPPIPPSIDVTLNLNGSSSRSCSEAGGTTFNMTTNITLKGETALDKIEWYFDNQFIGTGKNLSYLVPADNQSHNMTVRAYNTTGQSDSAYYYVRVYDYQAPVVNVNFIDNSTGKDITSINSAKMHHVKPVITVTDSCDPMPSYTANASPVYSVNDETILSIQGNLGTINMPTSAVELKVNAVDNAGNSRSASATLPIN